MSCFKWDNCWGEDQTVIIKECFDKIDAKGRVLHSIAIGTGFVEMLSGAIPSEIIKGMHASKNEVVLHSAFPYQEVAAICGIEISREDASIREEKCEEMFESLKQNIGKKVKCLAWHYGMPMYEEGILSEVNEYCNLVVNHTGIPFVGYGAAISYVRDEIGMTLFENETIPDAYDVRDREEIYDFKKLLYGNRIVDEKYNEEVKAEEKRELYLAKSAEHDRNNRQRYIEEGLKLVKPEIGADWITFVTNNTEDGYSACVVEASINLMKKIETGVSYEEALDLVFNKEMGLTGYQAGSVANVVAQAYINGEQFRQYWNSRYGVKDEEVKETVNPAVLTLKKK